MGDKPKKDSPFINSTFSDLTPNSALKLMKNFNNGLSINGTKLKSSSNFFKGAAFNPSTKNLEKDKAIFEITRLISSRIEQWIIDKPEQWLWAHRRWGKRIKTKNVKIDCFKLN